MRATTGRPRALRRVRVWPIAAALVAGILVGVVVAPAVQSAIRDGSDGAVAGPAVVYGQPTATGSGDQPLPAVAARSFAVYDATAGRFLASRGLDVELPVASITKLMTASVVIAEGDLDRTVQIPALETARDELVAGLEAGEELTRRQLLALLLIPSAGDAAEALAATGGTTRGGFVDRMNARARTLGLRHTRYVNPVGLDAPGQHSTARDVVVLAARVMRSPTIRAIVRRTEARLHGRVLTATNRLLGTGFGIDGVKTGHTDEAGWCIVASVVHRGHRIVIAVLGAPGEALRDTGVRALLSWAQAAGR